MDLDIAFLEGKPIVSDESPSRTKEKLGKWKKSNRVSLMIIKGSIFDTIHGSVPSCETVMEFLDVIGKNLK